MLEHRCRYLAALALVLVSGFQAPQDSARAVVPFPKAEASIVLKGSCLFAGEPPPIQRLVMPCPNATAAYKDRDLPIEPSLQMDPQTRGLPNCLVRVDGLEKRWRFAVPEDPVRLAFKDHLLVPHVMGLMVDQELHAGTEDACTYNLHWMGKLNRPPRSNVTMKQRDRQVWVFKVPEVARFKDDVHGWIKAHVHVLPHPVFAVTDDSGRFALPKLPAGEYEVVAWHERWKTEPQRVVLAAEHAERGKIIRFRFQVPAAQRR